SGTGAAISRGPKVVDQSVLETIDLLGVVVVASKNVLSQILLVDLLMPGKYGGEERGSGRASDIARQIGEAGNVVVAPLRRIDIDQCVDRHEKKCKPNRLQKAQLRRIGKTHLKIEAGHVVESKRDSREPERDKITAIDLRDQHADDGHTENSCQAACGHR